jgi:hypothetical protein
MCLNSFGDRTFVSQQCALSSRTSFEKNGNFSVDASKLENWDDPGAPLLELWLHSISKKKKIKAIPVTGRGGL